MEDTFALQHSRIVLTPKRHEFQDCLWNDLEWIGESKLTNIRHPFFEQSLFSRLFVKHFELCIEEELADVRVSNFFDRLLLEVGVLHCIYNRYRLDKDEQPTDANKRSVVILGVMIQHRLTILLSFTNPIEYTRLFTLGKMPGFSQDEWETAFIGATACARTILILSRLPSCEIYLPTVHEDADLGVDLCVKAGNRYLAISVKTGAPERSFRVEHVHTRPQEEQEDKQSLTRRRIFDGANKLTDETGLQFVAIRVIGGRPNGKPFDLRVYGYDVQKFRKLYKRLNCPSLEHLEHADEIEIISEPEVVTEIVA